MSLADTLAVAAARTCEPVAVAVIWSAADTTASSYTSTVASVVPRVIELPANRSTLFLALSARVSVFIVVADATSELSVSANTDMLAPEETATLSPAITETSDAVTVVASDADILTSPAELRTASSLPATADDMLNPTLDVVISAVVPASRSMSAVTEFNDVTASKATVDVVRVVSTPANSATLRSAFAVVSWLVRTPTVPTPDTLTSAPVDTAKVPVSTPTVPFADTLTSFSANSDASVVRTRALVSESSSYTSVNMPIVWPAVRSNLVSAAADAVVEPMVMLPPLFTEVSAPTLTTVLPLVISAFPIADASIVALANTFTASVDTPTPPPYESTARLPAVSRASPLVVALMVFPDIFVASALSTSSTPLYSSVWLDTNVMFGVDVWSEDVATVVVSDMMNSCRSPLAILVSPPLEVVSVCAAPAEDIAMPVLAVSRLRPTGASMAADRPAVTLTSPHPAKVKSADVFNEIPSRDVMLMSSTEYNSNEPV